MRLDRQFVIALLVPIFPLSQPLAATTSFYTPKMEYSRTTAGKDLYTYRHRNHRKFVEGLSYRGQSIGAWNVWDKEGQLVNSDLVDTLLKNFDDPGEIGRIRPHLADLTGDGIEEYIIQIWFRFKAEAAVAIYDHNFELLMLKELSGLYNCKFGYGLIRDDLPRVFYYADPKWVFYLWTGNSFVEICESEFNIISSPSFIDLDHDQVSELVFHLPHRLDHVYVWDNQQLAYVDGSHNFPDYRTRQLSDRSKRRSVPGQRLSEPLMMAGEYERGALVSKWTMWRDDGTLLTNDLLSLVKNCVGDQPSISSITAFEADVQSGGDKEVLMFVSVPRQSLESSPTYLVIFSKALKLLWCNLGTYGTPMVGSICPDGNTVFAFRSMCAASADFCNWNFYVWLDGGLKHILQAQSGTYHTTPTYIDLNDDGCNEVLFANEQSAYHYPPKVYMWDRQHRTLVDGDKQVSAFWNKLIQYNLTSMRETERPRAILTSVKTIANLYTRIQPVSATLARKASAGVL